MKIKSSILTALCLVGISTSAFAEGTLSAAPGSTQLVTVMNNLYNPAAPDHTKTDITVQYRDGKGDNICWIENKIAFHADPNVAGAGGRNDCGKQPANPRAIVKIDIIPRSTLVGKVYENLLNVEIPDYKFYISVLVEQDKPPVYNNDGSIKTLGTVKVRKFFDNE